MAGHFLREFDGLAGAQDREIVSGVVSQQSRRNVYGCDARGWSGDRELWAGLRGRGLRQRRIRRPLSNDSRLESLVPQSREWKIRRRYGKSGRGQPWIFGECGVVRL